MELDKMTIGELKEVKNLLGHKTKKKDWAGGIKIVILQRGWIGVGEYFEHGDDCRLESCAIIRSWGTTKGLGEIAKNGPTNKTILDWCPTIRFHRMVVVATIDCEAGKWELKK